MMGGSENVPKMISALGRLLEVSMNKGEDEITLKQELELTESYVYIENIKNNCGLKLTFDVDENTENLKILKLILQPIVENSIIHGFKNRKADDEIKIGAKTEENKLIVSVRDNGAGINKEKIDQILYSGLDQGRHKYSGIGLININERLRIKYGSDFGLKIESEENEGTTVSILLPILKSFTGGQAVDKGTDS
jgi:two-component system sensor histidine kinase YesM